MKKYLIFRTDRIGDFLFSLKFIKIIKLNDPHSEITIIASERNHNYIKTFNVIDKIILLKNNLFAKINDSSCDNLFTSSLPNQIHKDQ